MRGVVAAGRPARSVAGRRHHAGELVVRPGHDDIVVPLSTMSGVMASPIYDVKQDIRALFKKRKTKEVCSGTDPNRVIWGLFIQKKDKRGLNLLHNSKWAPVSIFFYFFISIYVIGFSSPKVVIRFA